MGTFVNAWPDAVRGNPCRCLGCGEVITGGAAAVVAHECPGAFDVYADGGVILRNPSGLAGTWSWVHVRDEVEIAAGAGYVTPADAGLPSVTNNYAEFMAMLLALEAVHDGWNGIAYTDSQVTLRRFIGRGTNLGIPDGLWQRMKDVRKRLGAFRIVLLGGHPTAEELRRGTRKDGYPCSRWNVLCDQRCGQQAALFIARRGGDPADLAKFKQPGRKKANKAT